MADFADRLALVMKALAWSRGRLASELAVDKSVVSRWLSGASAPGNHNATRLTSLVARSVPGFTMVDWDLTLADLAARLGVAAPSEVETAPPPPAPSQPDLASLPGLVAARLDTAARGRRYCGLWRLLRPMMARPDGFVCEHIAIRRDGDWLKCTVHNVIAELPGVGFIADGHLYLLISVQNAVVTLLFNRVDEPIIDQVDGLILSTTVAADQTPSASRLVMQRLAGTDAGDDDIAAVLATHAAERRILPAAEMDAELARALLPDIGPAALAAGGERLLRAGTEQALVRSRWT